MSTDSIAKHERGTLLLSLGDGRDGEWPGGVVPTKQTNGRTAEATLLANVPQIDIAVLGGVVVRRTGKLVALGGVQQRRLVGLLCAHGGRVVAIGQIVDALWDGSEPPSAPERTIQTYISRLRGSLGDATIRREPGGYRLDSAAVRLDADEFRALLRSSRGRPPAELVPYLEGALALWSGRPFGEFADEAWALETVRQLEELRLSALEDCFGARIALGEFREVVVEVASAAAQNPSRPLLTAHLMVALARSGRQADALRVFQTHRRHILDESGLDPARMLIELERQILANDSDVCVPEAVPEIRGYELQASIGSGRIGTVYRARQPVTNRSVAVKVIDTQIADDPEFIRRFEARAQRIARLEHPSVAPLYDFWREPGAAYLVYRLFAGGDLADARQRQPKWELSRVTRFVNDIGGALSSGHRIGLFHNNLHDGNVLFDEHERPFLVDYPIHLLEDQTDEHAAADVHEFVALVWSLLAGRRLLASERDNSARSLTMLRSDVPETVVDLLARSIDSPSAQNIESFVNEWNRVCAGFGVVIDSPVQWRDENPYKGLRPFDEGDVDDFFGRERLVAELEQRIETEQAIFVVGPSGSGKSSVIRAGLVPRLRERGWVVATMRPGPNPLEGLTEALATTASRAFGGTLDATKRLIVIDQMEELYTVCENDAVREQFVRDVVAALRPSADSVHLVATLRADFLGVALANSELGPLIGAGTVLITPMSSLELESAVRGPAQRYGFTVDSTLVAQIVADVNARPGSLPLLQFALFELVEQRSSRTLSFSDYDGIGGVGGALSRHAEAVHAQLDAADQNRMRSLVARLVSFSEHQPWSSRRVPLRSLPDSSRPVLDKLVDSRLLTVSHDVVTREPIAELAHESILWEWDRIRGWLEQDLDDLRTLRHIDEAARAWDVGGRADSDLYRGARLQAALDWRLRGDRSLTAIEERFLSESDAFAKRAATLRERSLRRVRALSGGLALLLALTVIGGVTAVGQRGRAQRLGDASETKRLLATAVTLTGDAPAVSFLLANEGAKRRGDPVDVSDTMLRVLGAHHGFLGFAALERPLASVVLSHDGKRVVGINEAEAVVIDIDTHRVLARRALPRRRSARPLILKGAANTVLVSEGDYDLRVLSDISLTDKESRLALPGAVRAAATNKDGSLLAVAGDFGSVDVWDTRARRLIRTLSIPTRAISVAFTANGKELVIGESQSFSVWNLPTGKEQKRFTSSSRVFAVLSAEEVGGFVVSSTVIDGESRIALVDQRSGVERWSVVSRTTDPVRLSPMGLGSILAVDGRGVRRLDLRSGEATQLDDRPATDALALRDGSRYVVADVAATLSFRSIKGDSLLGTSLPGTGGPCRLQASKDGRFVACTDRVRVWDVATDRHPKLVLDDPAKSGFLLAQGHALLIDRTGGWQIVDLARGSVVLKKGSATRTVLNGGPGLGRLSVASPSGRWLAVGVERNLWIVDLQTNESVALVELDPLSPEAPTSAKEVWFANDGRSLFARLGNGQVRRWSDSQWIGSRENDSPSRRRGAMWFDGASRGEEPIAVSRSSDAVLTRSVHGALEMKVVDRQTGIARSGGFVGSKARVDAASFDWNERWLATVEADGSMRIWDVVSRRVVGPSFAIDAQTPPVFVEGEHLRIAAVSGDRVVLWNLDRQLWTRAACGAAGRNLTQLEWQELGPRGQRVQATCPEWAAG